MISPEHQHRIIELTQIYKAQSEQLEKAYEESDPVSWRRHPLSPLTPLLLSHVAANRTLNGNSTLTRPKVIDLGCGAGEKTDKLRAFTLDVIGVDMVDNALHEAKNITAKQTEGSTMTFLKADIKNLPFANEVFDGAHDYLAFLHIIRDEWSQYINSVHRVLKKGSPLLLVTFSGNDPDFYGYPINQLEQRGIVFSDKSYRGDTNKIAHLINSYFYFPKKEELETAFRDQFDILRMVEISHPLYKESTDHRQRKLWHILLIKR